MTAEKTKKRKVVSAITAVTAAAAILLTGTYTWQSISQTALNETMSAVNPGGRLHDDFDGRNKDVYVENFTDPENGGVPIYARVRLDEYMEIGTGAGLKTGDAGADSKTAESLIDGADLNNVTTWKTHIPGATDDPFHEYWSWKTGGQTVYMPTFNKNKDSLKADINGTYAGVDNNAATGTPYDDYVDYSDPNKATKTADAVYDNDDNKTDEGAGATVPENIQTVEETHTAKATGTATILTMQEWLDAGAQPGSYWVYDVDGWAYWAEPIAPGTATGLLLDGITLQKEPDEDWYYGINVVGQFATQGDWGSTETGDGFFGPDAGPAPTSNAFDLLNKIAGLSEEEPPAEEPWSTALAAITPGSTDTVAIDGREWYVLAKKDGKALIWAKEMETTFGTAGKGQFSPSFTENGSLWQNSGARTWLNGDYLESLSTLKAHAVETTITSRNELATAEWYETTDKVFLLSEADLFGTVNKEATSAAQDYTYGTSQLVPNAEMRKCQSSGEYVDASCYWLRSLHTNNYIVACCYSGSGDVIFDYPNGTNAGIRPAMWVNLAS